MVNYTGGDCRFAHMVFFVEVSKDKNDWRKEILPRRRMEDEEKQKAE